MTSYLLKPDFHITLKPLRHLGERAEPSLKKGFNYIIYFGYYNYKEPRRKDIIKEGFRRFRNLDEVNKFITEKNKSFNCVIFPFFLNADEVKKLK